MSYRLEALTVWEQAKASVVTVLVNGHKTYPMEEDKPSLHASSKLTPQWTMKLSIGRVVE